MSDLFTTPDQEITIDPNKDYLPELVGEDKKFKTPADLARGKVESDAFIERLKRENAELRSKKETEISMQTFLDNLDKKLKPQPAQEEQRTTPAESTAEPTKGISEEDIVRLLESREAAKQKQANLEQAVSAAKKAFGANYSLVLEQKVQELGISKDFLTSVAEKNVSAFLRLVGAEVKTEDSTLFPTSSVSTTRPSNPSTGKKFSDFEKLRKENPSKYLSSQVQNEMMAEALKQGESFYS